MIVVPEPDGTRYCATTITQCPNIAVAVAVWDNHDDCTHPTTDYCAEHRDRVLNMEAEGEHVSCGHGECKNQHRRSLLREMLPLTYAQRRKEWMKHGGIERKEAMVAAVHLHDPAGWDTFGSLLAWPPPPPAAPVPARRVRRVAIDVAFWIAVQAVVCTILYLTGVFH